MKRSLLIALAICVPLAIFIPAKIAASWRPVVLADVSGGSRQFDFPFVAATAETLMAGDDYGKAQRFDLATGRTRERQVEGICRGGVASWRLNNAKTPQLQVQRDGQTRVYAVPVDAARRLGQAARATIIDGGTSLGAVTVVDGPQFLDMLVAERFLRWNKATAKLERDFTFVKFSNGHNGALTRDGKSILMANWGETQLFSTRDGQLQKSVKWAISEGAQGQVSPFGSYFVWRSNMKGGERWWVMDTRSGQQLWSVDWDVSRDCTFFSPDETLLAVARPSVGLWHLHNARDGHLIRTLPLVPGIMVGAFSPDNNTLYSVADGVLYRQRAR